jgi:hypothetical protein
MALKGNWLELLMVIAADNEKVGYCNCCWAGFKGMWTTNKKPVTVTCIYILAVKDVFCDGLVGD